MAMKSTKEGQTRKTTTEQQGHRTRLNFSNPQQREAHIRAFLQWLPQILHEAPGIDWERMPSQVMGYLIRRVASSIDVIPNHISDWLCHDEWDEGKGLVRPLHWDHWAAETITVSLWDDDTL
jgi:hypothetical protein